MTRVSYLYRCIGDLSRCYKPAGRAIAISKAIISRVGRAHNGVPSILELPCNAPRHVSDLVIVPASPPYVPDDEPSSSLQQCPHCRGLIRVDDPGISYCYKCGHLIFIGDGLEVVEPEPLPYHCPVCGGALDDNDVEWTGRGWFFCRLCGQVMNWRVEHCDGFQIVDPQEMGGTPISPRCPECGGVLQQNNWEATARGGSVCCLCGMVTS